ncbi:hypothetical protein I4U23_013693 [Adineta vaga]|nr:hypothetical protein I4U23_013693 [Adineta vaga]
MGISSLFITSSINIKRKLFDSNSSLSIIRSQSDPLVENVNKIPQKESPYIMFYRKYYQLVLTRFDLLCSQNNSEFYLYLFENYTKILFCQKDLDQILLSSIYFISNSESVNLTCITLLQMCKSIQT